VVPPRRAFIAPSDMAEAPVPPASRRSAGDALSLVSDIGRGWPADEAMRACLVTSALARIVSVSPGEASAIYYTALLRSVGCTATSHENAALDGDDVAVRRRGDLIHDRAPREDLRSPVGNACGTVGYGACRSKRLRPVVQNGTRC
jgi:hypothetical protein